MVNLQLMYASLRTLQTVVQALDDDEKQVLAGTLAMQELEARRHNLHAQKFRQVLADLSKLGPTPDDARYALQNEMKRAIGLMVAILSMPSVLPVGAKEPQPADPARMKVLQDELKQSAARLSMLTEQGRTP